MGNNNNGSSIRTKVALLVVDKLVLALIVLGAGFFFNFLLQQEKTRGDYQKQIFDRRVDAYVTILEEAKRARDLLAILYGLGTEPENLGELSRRGELDELLGRLRRLVPSSVVRSTGSRRGEPWVHYERVVQPLIEIERITRENDLYMSEYAKERVADFLDVVTTDLSKSLEQAELDRQEQSSDENSTWDDPADIAFRQEAWRRAEEAYRRLREGIKQSLDIEGIPIG